MAACCEHFEVPELFQQLSSWVRTLCVGGAELLEVFSWNREAITIRVL